MQNCEELIYGKKMDRKKKNIIKLLRREDAIAYTRDKVLKIPDTFTGLSDDFAYFVVRPDLPHVRTLEIPKSITYISSMRGDPSCGPYGYRNNPFEEIVVSAKNKCYASKDGVLFSKDMHTLISYPCGKKDKVYQIPEGVQNIEREAFLNVEHLRTIHFPQSLETIQPHAFSACLDLDFPDAITMYRIDQGYLLDLPAMTDAVYDPEDSIYYCVSNQNIRKISDDDFYQFILQGASVIENDKERRTLLSILRDVIDRAYWGSDANAELKELRHFKNTFFSDHI